MNEINNDPNIIIELNHWKNFDKIPLELTIETAHKLMNEIQQTNINKLKNQSFYKENLYY
jgi:hypothetical protein